MSQTAEAPEGVPFTPLTDFRHHKTSYEKDVPASAPYGLVTYFVLNGWAKSEYVDEHGDWSDPAEVVVDLEVQDVVQTQSNEVN